MSGAALRHEVGADAAVAASIEHCVHVLRERLGSRLVGIVLTGSFARGEGTVVPIDGHLRVLGDIEFLVILPHGRDYRALRPALAGWSRQVSQTLFRLMSSIRSHCASVMSQLPRSRIPAFATRMSIRPNSASVPSTTLAS